MFCATRTSSRVNISHVFHSCMNSNPTVSTSDPQAKPFWVAGRAAVIHTGPVWGDQDGPRSEQAVNMFRQWIETAVALSFQSVAVSVRLVCGVQLSLSTYLSLSATVATCCQPTTNSVYLWATFPRFPEVFTASASSHFQVAFVLWMSSD